MIQRFSCHKFKSKHSANTEKIYTMPILVFWTPINYLSNGGEHSFGKLNVLDILKTHSILFWTFFVVTIEVESV